MKAIAIASDEPPCFRLARQVEHDADQTSGVEQADRQDRRELDDEDQDVETLDRVAQKLGAPGSDGRSRRRE